MSYLPQVIGARYVRGFIVSTRFDDGTEKHIDVSRWFKGPVFEPAGPKPQSAPLNFDIERLSIRVEECRGGRHMANFKAPPANLSGTSFGAIATLPARFTGAECRYPTK